MFKENYNVIGVMSGTSLDGVDLAYIKFNNSNRWTFEIFQSETISYSEEWLIKLKNAIHFNPSELEELNVAYTKLLASIINDFISKNNLTKIDAVCSHGHTILHQPQNGFTLQIGNLPMIRDLVNHTIVCDFRVQDVQLGGQGAPLVPIGDELLFSEYDYCLNLGGFSNVSFNENGKRIAFDISPVNTVLNFYANELGFAYDDAGSIAKSGNVNKDLLKQLNGLEFYALPYPKSLGMEFVNAEIFPLMHSFQIDVKDKLRTFVEHIAVQVAKICCKSEASLFITGGGAYNRFLTDRLSNYLPTTNIVIPDDKTIQFKEALIFGFLGVLRLRNEINVLSSVTGAKENHSSGVVFI
ncbi:MULTISPECIES: anhydro-N-acetylmuramic acid kinase [unclassified Flavobacterium]|uniref:anhydro-N-acetylmuramic acid kinase n=1 Tax=unclassified Flavobacterium TaxID=196869 RepID=UPI001290D0EA|nr:MULTISPECIES: anhydro-N-acetylmuramic acid kinase [unclassified Flavobacterium]MQP53669.1 anhydro-N-acetylmuramic acid kinase [Flavobacterium sp. LMO9]MQP63600.1 anhydro-N-acetylmuramic acid kinase [Flavobacterium sp. LMO6]